tara:strand:+ start:144 stop:605 length:462 start_codon:yes stop_codon:yes gene_type:complete
MASFYSADNTALQQWFGQVDTDRSGQVNAKELQRALAQGGLNFSTKLVASMIRMYDADKTAQLSLAQFIELHKFLVNVQHVFATADRDRSGQLDLNECVPASNAPLRRSRRAAPLPPRRSRRAGHAQPARTGVPDACGGAQDLHRALRLGARP